MKLLSALLIIFTATIFSSQSAHAHVLITDDRKTQGAILHINPDDDPVAGKPSTFFFDMQEIALVKSPTAKLIINSDSVQEEVEGTLDSSLIVFEYTFPTQGVYRLQFQVATDDQTYTFTQPWRVSRGEAADTYEKTRHVWAEITLLLGGTSFALLITIIFGRWKYIWRQSTF